MADDPASATTNTNPGTTGTVAQPRADDDGWDPVREFAARVGIWGVHSTGSNTKTGEYQDLGSSPFWDVDTMMSNGQRTVSFSATGTDNESTDGRLRFYGGPRLSANVAYERFPHQMGSNNYSGFLPNAVTSAPPDPAKTVLYTRDNQTPGQDYAIRVQEVKANFKGNLTDDIKWRVNVFAIEKEGDRQANSMAHCYQNPSAGSGLTSQCHVVSQSQHIDWRTTEVEPAIEIRLIDGFIIEYSHMARTFEQNDGIVQADWNGFGSLGFTSLADPDGTAGYAFVPDSVTNIDRIKIHGELGCDTDVYSYGFVGNTKNEFRKMNRHFGGADLRVTNSSIDSLTLTGYGKVYTERTGVSPAPLSVLYPTAELQNLYQESAYSAAVVDRDTDAVGLNARWRPFQHEDGTLRSRMAITAGYEWSELRRVGVDSEIVRTGVDFIQPSTVANMFSVGVEEKWSRQFSSYLRYKFIATQYPLFGIESHVLSTSLDDALNTALPTRENRVEVGGNWTPSECFMLNGTVYLENASNHGPWAEFDSSSYPYIISAMYAPTQRWTWTGGYANFPSWINQTSTFADLRSTSTALPTNVFNDPLRYSGQADVFNLATRYACTSQLTLSSEFEYVYGLNEFVATKTPTGAVSYADLGTYSMVKTQTVRIGAGVDYLVRPHVTTYVRYNYFDYGDLATGLQTGQAHMFLGGLTATF